MIQLANGVCSRNLFENPFLSTDICNSPEFWQHRAESLKVQLDSWFKLAVHYKGEAMSCEETAALKRITVLFLVAVMISGSVYIYRASVRRGNIDPNQQNDQ